MTDPSPNPEFPNRPDHPDFRSLSLVVQSMDATSQDIQATITKYIDEQTLIYMAVQRALRITLIDNDFLTTMPALYMDGFLAGCAFTQAKQQEKENFS